MPRCGKCQNCLDLERVKARLLAIANPPFSHADEVSIELWNAELKRLPCTQCSHTPNWNTVTPADGAPGIVDICCQHCGKSGSVSINIDDINWE